jgi:sugar-specific transcriptional regulator TrmB
MKDKLKAIGLTDYESKIYLTLLEQGKLNAKKISEISKVPPTAVYPNIKSLHKKNLIQIFDGEVKTFEALHPELSIPTFLEQRRQELYNQEKEIIPLAIELKNKPKIESKVNDILNISTGQAASTQIYYKTIDEAKKSIFIMGWRLHEVKNKYTFLQKFKPALKRKVDIRILLTGRPEKAWELIKAYQRAGIKIKYLPLENDKFTLTICDNKDCKITLKRRDLPEQYNIFIHDISLANAMQSYFLENWNQAKIINPK